MAAVVLPFCWRRSANDIDPTTWNVDAEEWMAPSCDLRRRLASTCGSDIDQAVKHPPLVVYCDEAGKPTGEPFPVDDYELLSCIPSSNPFFLEQFPNGKPKFMLLFTFPPAQSLAAAPLAPSSDIVNFWRALPSAVLTPDGFLQLPQGVFWLGEELLGSIILVRSCYVSLYDIITDTTTSMVQRWLVTGNPGIGKTMFTAYMLYRLAREERTVIWEPEEGPSKKSARYLLKSDGTVLRGEVGRSFEDAMGDKAAWVLTDAHAPDFTSVKARTLMVTSPRRDHFTAYTKQTGADYRYMPVWSWEEVYKCWRKIYPKVPLDRVKYLYSLWGGIARQVLQKALLSTVDVSLDTAIESCNLAACKQSVGQLAGKDDISHRVLHIIVENRYGPDGAVVDPFIHTHIEFASKYVADKMILKFWANERVDLLSFLRSSAGESNAAGMRGILFESIAHMVLLRGGKFTVRHLGSASTEEKYLPPRTLQSFDDLDKVNLSMDTIYYRPVSSNLAAVDALANNMLFQMTVSESHPVKMAGLKKAVQQVLMIGRDVIPQLIFVVPSDIFSSFGPQRYTTTKKEEAVSIGKDLEKVKQYALSIDLSSVSIR